MVLERRKCLTHDEDFEKLDPNYSKKYKPKYFSHYTMQGCVMECRAKYSMYKCGCLPYYYPEFKDIKMCNVSQIQCLSEIAGSRNIDCRFSPNYYCFIFLSNLYFCWNSIVGLFFAYSFIFCHGCTGYRSRY